MELGAWSREAEGFCTDPDLSAHGRLQHMTSCLVHLYSVSNGSCLHIHSLYLPVLIDSLWVMVSLPEDLGAVTPCSHHRALVCASLGLRLSHRSTSTYFRTLCSNVNTQKRDAEINTFNLWGNILWLHYKNWMNSSEYSNMDIFFFQLTGILEYFQSSGRKIPLGSRCRMRVCVPTHL